MSGSGGSGSGGGALVPQIDGAYFGPTFPHLFFMTFHDEMPKEAPLPYVPKVGLFCLLVCSVCLSVCLFVDMSHALPSSNNNSSQGTHPITTEPITTARRQ
jgi:hypothetical protein